MLAQLPCRVTPILGLPDPLHSLTNDCREPAYSKNREAGLALCTGALWCQQEPPEVSRGARKEDTYSHPCHTALTESKCEQVIRIGSHCTALTLRHHPKDVVRSHGGWHSEFPHSNADQTLAFPSDKGTAPKLDWRSHHSVWPNLLPKEHCPCRSLAEGEPASSPRVAIQRCW